MQEIQTPLRCPELDVKGEAEHPLTISDKVQQTLSVLTGFWKNRRTLLKSSPSGILFTASPQIEDIIHVTGVGANDNYQGDAQACTEVLVMAHPDNVSKVWVRTKESATVNNAWPLDANDVVSFTVTNMSMLHALIVGAGEKLIIAYTM